jgi:DNA adenine methylase
VSKYIRLPLKHAGSKWNKLDFLISHFPKDAPFFFDSFAGLGTVGINYARLNVTELISSDLDQRLFRLACVMQNEKWTKYVCDLVKEILENESLSDKYDLYKKTINTRKDIPLVWHVAMEIFLNRCSYGGLWRVNSKGMYNVPFSQHSRKSFDTSAFKAYANVYRGIRQKYFCDDYTDIASKYRGKVPLESIFYFDPPYDATFQGYNKEKFDLGEFVRTCNVLKDDGYRVYVSQRFTEKIEKMFDGWNVIVYSNKKAISTNSDKPTMTECLIY